MGVRPRRRPEQRVPGQPPGSRSVHGQEGARDRKSPHSGSERTSPPQTPPPAPGHARDASQGTGRSPLGTSSHPRLPAARSCSEGFFGCAPCTQGLNFPDQGLTPHALRDVPGSHSLNQDLRESASKSVTYFWTKPGREQCQETEAPSPQWGEVRCPSETTGCAKPRRLRLTVTRTCSQWKLALSQNQRCRQSRQMTQT